MQDYQSLDLYYCTVIVYPQINKRLDTQGFLPQLKAEIDRAIETSNKDVM
jgi:hypothetical protein